MPVFNLQTLSRGVPKATLLRKQSKPVQLRLPGSHLDDVLRAKADLEVRLGASVSFTTFVLMAAEALALVLKKSPDWTPRFFDPNKTL